jgi:ssDNA-binding Zn-finger/Zn-ribbon topoisomerase 1
MPSSHSFLFHVWAEVSYTAIQIYRFARYNFFPARCPRCNHHVLLTQSEFGYKMKNISHHPTMYQGKKFVCDYLHCTKCVYIENLDKECVGD